MLANVAGYEPNGKVEEVFFELCPLLHGNIFQVKRECRCVLRTTDHPRFRDVGRC